MNQEMGTANVKGLMVKFAVPAVVGQVINLLYNIVDRIYIGHIPEVGASALTGVGLFTPILMLITAFALLAGAGGAPRAAIAMGKPLIPVHHIRGHIAANYLALPYALDYARIYILGSVFVMIVMGMNPFITTQGFAKMSMLTTVIGAVINIALDPIFIFALDLGVQGAAMATVLSQTVSAVWVLMFLSGR